MEMEKEIAEIIHQYCLIDFDTELGAIHIPVSAFTERGLAFNKTILGFSLLSNHGVLNHEQCKGQLELENGKNQWHFQVVPQTDIDAWERNGDTENLEGVETAWRIFVDPKKIAAFVKKPKAVATTQTQPPDKKAVLYFTSNGELFVDEKHYLSLKKEGIPFKVFKYFVENPNTNYELTTNDMAAALDIDAAQFRNEIGKLKQSAAKSFGFKGSFALLENKRFSGYRLNPLIEIIERT